MIILSNFYFFYIDYNFYALHYKFESMKIFMKDMTSI